MHWHAPFFVDGVLINTSASLRKASSCQRQPEPDFLDDAHSKAQGCPRAVQNLDNATNASSSKQDLLHERLSEDQICSHSQTDLEAAAEQCCDCGEKEVVRKRCSEEDTKEGAAVSCEDAFQQPPGTLTDEDRVFYGVASHDSINAHMQVLLVDGQAARVHEELFSLLEKYEYDFFKIQRAFGLVRLEESKNLTYLYKKLIGKDSQAFHLLHCCYPMAFPSLLHLYHCYAETVHQRQIVCCLQRALRPH
jgi:hypothetical protein